MEKKIAQCKFTLDTISESRFNQGGKYYNFSPIQDAKLPEDKAFTKYTPNGKFEAFICNPNVIAKLELGKTYILDITPDEEANV